jgi:vesicle coat complex subunit
MEAFMFVSPQSSGDAEALIDRIAPRLQHANAGVVLTAVKVVIHLLNFVTDADYVNSVFRKMAPPLGKISRRRK